MMAREADLICNESMSQGKFVPNERLWHARTCKGWSQARLAEEVGTSFEMVSRWERGITVPSPYYRERLCAVLGQSAEELGLLRGLQEPPPPLPAPLLFLACSHADAEKAVVSQLKVAFEKRGITLWSSRQFGRQAGAHPRKALQEVVCAAQAILVILSPEARSSRHVRDALEMASMYQRPVCGVWIEGESWQACLPTDGSELAAWIDVRTAEDSARLEEIVAAVQRLEVGSQESKLASLPAAEAREATWQPRNPYKGLRAFRREDVADFFGRNRLIAELVETVKRLLTEQQPDSNPGRLLALIGASGSGKSSVMMAGLLPQLGRGTLPGSEQWDYLEPMRPGEHPLEALALTLAPHFPQRSVESLREELNDESARGLHRLASCLVRMPQQKVVLLIDQFEEVFTQTASEWERECFIDLLVTALTEPQGPTFVLLTLRADFYDRPMSYSTLHQLIETHQKAVLPMDPADLRTAIKGPAALPDVQLSFEETLVGDLLFEMQGQVGALPLLQFTLDQLFQRRSGSLLTLQAYQEMGGVKGALVKQAESSYAALHSEEHRRLARALFLRLIDPGTGKQDTTRRRASRAELSLAESKQTALLQEVADAFIAARLLTTNEVAGTTTIEVSHEALIREWPRLLDWLREGREDIHLQQAVSQDVAEWERRGKPRDRLYRGSQLKEAGAWAKRNFPSTNEVAFLHASVASRMRFLVSMIAVLLIIVSSIGGQVGSSPTSRPIRPS